MAGKERGCRNDEAGIDRRHNHARTQDPQGTC